MCSLCIKGRKLQVPILGKILQSSLFTLLKCMQTSHTLRISTASAFWNKIALILNTAVPWVPCLQITGDLTSALKLASSNKMYLFQALLMTKDKILITIEMEINNCSRPQ